MPFKDVVYNTVVAGLITVNGFFVARLVNKLESIEIIVWQLRQDVVVLQTLQGVKHVGRN